MQDLDTRTSPLTAAQRLRVYGALGERTVTITALACSAAIAWGIGA